MRSKFHPISLFDVQLARAAHWRVEMFEQSVAEGVEYELFTRRFRKRLGFAYGWFLWRADKTRWSKQSGRFMLDPKQPDRLPIVDPTNTRRILKGKEVGAAVERRGDGGGRFGYPRGGAKAQIDPVSRGTEQPTDGDHGTYQVRYRAEAPSPPGRRSSRHQRRRQQGTQMCEGTSEGTRFARLESPGAFVFTVPDRPIPKLRERRGGGGGKTPRTPEKVRDFELKVVWAAAEAGAIGEEPIFGSSEEGVDVWLFIHFGLGDDRRIGDLSNYQKAIEDGLNGKRIEFTQATDIGGERFEYGDTAHLGRVWRDDRRVSGAFTYRTFGGGEGVNVGVCKAGAVDTLAAFMDAVIDDFSDPEAVAL